MGGEWEELSLTDAGVSLFDCDHRTPAEASSGLPYVTIPQISNGEIDVRDARLISTADFVEWTRKASPQVHDVLLSRRCNPGCTAYVRAGQSFAVGQNLVLLRANGRRVLPSYLRWLTRGNGWWNEVERYRNQGAVFDSLKCRDIVRFRLLVPPRQIQQAIAELLGALDDKIELNRRMAETLEAMARALFRSWFVDFDPVHAHAERRPTGLPAALFPDRFGEDGLPRGWTREPFLEHARLISGGTPKTDQPAYWNGSIPWASAKDVSQCADHFLIGTERAITQRGLDESTTRRIPRLATVVVTRGATTGRYCLFGRDMAMNQTCYALANAEFPFWLSCAFGQLVDTLVKSAHGSVFDTITTTTLSRAKVIFSADALTAFESRASPMFERALVLIQQSASLAMIRDALLPKLISGELRIADAERQVAA